MATQKNKTNPTGGNIPNLTAQIAKFDIASLQDEITVGFKLEETGLYSAEISFHCEDSDRTHDRLGLGFQSGKGPGMLQDRPGDLHTWFGPKRTLNPETSYRFYFWVDEDMIYQLGEGQLFNLLLGRLDRVRSRWEGEFTKKLVNIQLPRLVGQVHFRTPNPVLVEAKPATEPIAQPVNLVTGEVIHYRIKASFPLLSGRMKPYHFKAEFRVPVSQGVLNADLGGFLLKNGKWTEQNNMNSSGTCDFIASRAVAFSKDDIGRRRAFPLAEDWMAFKKNGLFFVLDNMPAVKVDAYFYLAGGEIPPDYYVAELEQINLSTIPDEGDGIFWLHFDNISTVAWEEPAPASDNPFERPLPVERKLIQLTNTLFPFSHTGENRRRLMPYLPLFTLPVTALEGKEGLSIVTHPYYYHTMSVYEEAAFIVEQTEVVAVIEALATENGEKFLEATIKWIIKASKNEQPDLFRSFGAGSLQTDRNRGWALRNAPEGGFRMEGGVSSGSTTPQEVTGTNGRSVATVSEFSLPNTPGRSFSSTIRIRRIPGIFVRGATIKILSVKTNRTFKGHIVVDVGIIGHQGGREHTSSRGLKLESAALNSPFSYYASRITERGPFNLTAGSAHNINFPTIDFNHPDPDPDSLYERLSYTFGAWAGMHITVALAKVKMEEGQTDISPKRIKSVDHIDQGYLTVYPWDQLYDPVFGRLRTDIERQGDWLILRGRMEPHSYILDEVELEIRLQVYARDTGPMIQAKAQTVV